MSLNFVCGQGWPQIWKFPTVTSEYWKLKVHTTPWRLKLLFKCHHRSQNGDHLRQAERIVIEGVLGRFSLCWCCPLWGGTWVMTAQLPIISIHKTVRMLHLVFDKCMIVQQASEKEAFLLALSRCTCTPTACHCLLFPWAACTCSWKDKLLCIGPSSWSSQHLNLHPQLPPATPHPLQQVCPASAHVP